MKDLSTPITWMLFANATTPVAAAAAATVTSATVTATDTATAAVCHYFRIVVAECKEQQEDRNEQASWIRTKSHPQLCDLACVIDEVLC